ncbi:hypothetical protein GCM10009682_43840 [Luedemannella flava]|uniref:Integral membrane protein n=1 Tax=Luedemannella flava TaxID=349316 RepID=A0ABP4YI34_9ACTN
MAYDTDVDEETTTETGTRTSSGAGQEIYLGLLWLGTSMWVARQELAASGDAFSGAFGAAVAALPGVVAGTLVTAAGLAHTIAARFRSAIVRLGAGVLVGALFGVVAALGVRFAYGDAPSIMVLAATVAGAGALGGVVTALPDPVIEAGMWATSWTFFAGVIFGVLRPQVVIALGTGAEAQTRATYLLWLATGLIAAYFTWQKLPDRRRWAPVAGALPGLFLLAAELLTRLGGDAVSTLVFSAETAALSDAQRLRLALVVLVVGTFVTSLAALRRR